MMNQDMKKENGYMVHYLYMMEKLIFLTMVQMTK